VVWACAGLDSEVDAALLLALPCGASPQCRQPNRQEIQKSRLHLLFIACQSRTYQYCNSSLAMIDALKARGVARRTASAAAAAGRGRGGQQRGDVMQEGLFENVQVCRCRAAAAAAAAAAGRGRGGQHGGHWPSGHGNPAALGGGPAAAQGSGCGDSRGATGETRRRLGDRQLGTSRAKEVSGSSLG